MLIYQHVAIADLERNLQENFSELKGNTTAKWVGCLVYLYFIHAEYAGDQKPAFG